jgi:hypothetical protein
MFESARTARHVLPVRHRATSPWAHRPDRRASSGWARPQLAPGPLWAGGHGQQEPEDLVATFRWKSYPHDPAGECHCLTSVLPLRRYRDVPRFLVWTMRIRGQLGRSKGLIGYSLKAELSQKRFWTLSAWDTAEEMMDFVRSDVHAAMVQDMRSRLGRSVFREWAHPRADLPLSWTAAQERLGPPT